MSLCPKTSDACLGSLCPVCWTPALFHFSLCVICLLNVTLLCRMPALCQFFPCVGCLLYVTLLRVSDACFPAHCLLSYDGRAIVFVIDSSGIDKQINEVSG